MSNLQHLAIFLFVIFLPVGFNGSKLLCKSTDNNPPSPVQLQCRCQPGFEISTDNGGPHCQRCKKGWASTGVRCERCESGYAALAGKYSYLLRSNTLPNGFTASCHGDCSNKTGWIPAGDVIRTERVLGNVHAVLQLTEVEIVSELATIEFKCSVTCNLTGVPPKGVRGEHLAKIKDCDLKFQVWSNNTIQKEKHCTHPEQNNNYYNDMARRDGQIIAHAYSLKKGNYSFRWVFHQQDDTRALSTAFEGKLFNISVIGVKSGGARECIRCPAGYRSNLNNTECVICPSGTASSSGAGVCTPYCKDGQITTAESGRETCLPCGYSTTASPTKDSCDTCKFNPAEGVVYDLNKLSRPGGPMMLVTVNLSTHSPHRERRTMQYFAPRYDFYINLCTVHHDNSSCRSPDPVTENETIPAPLMACVSTFPAPKGDVVDMLTNIGSVVSFRPKHDVRSGLFVELLHGDKSPAGRANSCADKHRRFSALIDLRCDVTAGVGNPVIDSDEINLAWMFYLIKDYYDSKKCQYLFVWRSLYACPKCRKQDVTKMTDKFGKVTYIRSVPCWGTGEDLETDVAPTTNTVTVDGEEKQIGNRILIGVGIVVILVLMGV